MRYAGMALAVFLVVASGAAGQQAQQQPAGFGQAGLQQPALQPAPIRLDPEHNQLDFHLMQWEKKMSAINSLSAEIRRERVDKIYSTRELFVGSAIYLSWLDLASLLELRGSGARVKHRAHVLWT